MCPPRNDSSQLVVLDAQSHDGRRLLRVLALELGKLRTQFERLALHVPDDVERDQRELGRRERLRGRARAHRRGRRQGQGRRRQTLVGLLQALVCPTFEQREP